MGKHKRKYKDDDDLYRQVKKLKKAIKKKKRKESEPPTPTDTQAPEDTHADTNPTVEEIIIIDPTTEAEPTPEPSCDIEPEDLINEVLGEDPTKTNKYGTNIHNDIASRWEHIAKEGLTKDTKTELVKTALIPENCKFLEAPAINPEIKAAISEPVYKRDRVLMAQQNLLGQATASIAVALNAMLQDKSINIEITKNISNTGRLLCELFHTQSFARRSLIQFALNKDTKDIVQQTKIETQLFGDNLSEALKAGKAIHKTGSEIRYTKPVPEKPTPKPALNYRGPPRKQHRPQAPSAGRTTNNKQANKHTPQRASTQKTRPYRHRK